MPRKKKPETAAPKTTRRVRTVEEREEPVPDDLLEFAEVPEDELPPGVENVLEELGADVARVVLYRRLKGERQAYVGTIDADEFSLDLIARSYGGGRYIARFSGTHGGFLKGKPGYTFYIDESLKPEPKRPPTDEGNAVTGDGLTAKLLDKLLDARTQPAFDPAGAMASITAAAAAQSQAIMTAMMPLVAKITEMAAGGGGRGTSTADVLQAVELGISLGGKDEGYLPVIREVGKPLIEALNAMMQQRKGGTAPALAPGAAPAEAPPATPKEPPWVGAIRPYIARVVTWAQNNDDPGMWAQVLDRTQPDLAQWLDTAVRNPQFETSLYAHFPELGAWHEWVRRFLDEFGPEDELKNPTPESSGEPDAGE